MSAALELRDVGVRFGAFDAVDGVSLTVHAGEVVGLIGPNGAGKTVTFNVVTGLQPATRGRVLLDGLDVTRQPAHARTALGLARTFQVVQLFAGMSVLDNLMVAAHRHTRAGLVTDALRLPGRGRALA
ncbi:MAG: transporter related protein, partial [Frankiales bacterium]|nr:transporter related protein [Frankiales bacterium]